MGDTKAEVVVVFVEATVGHVEDMAVVAGDGAGAVGGGIRVGDVDFSLIKV